MTKKTFVEINEDQGIVKKTHKDRDSFELELHTTKAAHILGIESGLFYVPKILSVNPSKLSLIFEFIPFMTPLKEYLNEKHYEGLEHKIALVGKCLNNIHQKLCVDNIKVKIPFTNSHSSPESFIHGDFNLVNLNYDYFNKRLVILDWVFTPLIDMPGNWGSIYWDITLMLNSIFLCKSTIKVGYSKRRNLADKFLFHYFVNSSYLLSEQNLSSFCDFVFIRFAQLAFKNRGLFRFLLEMPNRFGLKLYLLANERKFLDN